MTDTASPSSSPPTATLGRGPAALACAAAICAVGVAWAARAAEGRAAIAESAAALDRGETEAAIHAARMAAAARCPTCDAPAAGYERLEAIARAAEAKGDDAAAFSAYGAMRAAALSTRPFAAGARRAQAEGELARLGQKIDATAALGGGAPSKAATEARLRDALARDGDALPSGATFGLLGLGAVLFAVSALRLARASVLRPADGAVALAGVGLAAAALALF